MESTKYEKKSSLAVSFTIMLIVYAVIAILLSTVLTYVNQKNQYEKTYQDTLRRETDYVKNVIEKDIESFKNVQDYFKENSDKILIPLDIDLEMVNEFQKEFENILKEQQPELPGQENAFSDYNDEVKTAYVKYWFSHFLLTIENAKTDFELDHTYYIYPASETEMVYMYDLAREEKVVDGKSYIDLGIVAKQDPEQYTYMWQTVKTGEKPEWFDFCDTEFGQDYMYYNPIKYNGEVLGLLTAEAAIGGVTQNIISSVLGLAGISFLVMLVCTFVVIQIVRRKMLKPLTNLERLTEEYSEKVDPAISERIRKVTDKEDEIGVLAKAQADMIVSLQEYIENIQKITEEREKAAAELSIAKNIQASALPNPEGAYADIDAFKIYASMCPAKEVGGDFYDFFMVDDTHLVTVIADVSGKGVPAALFMMISKLLLKNEAGYTLSPKNILEIVNNKLCENNAAEMFVTVWVGVLDITTGVMACANAGHEFPAVRKGATGQFELFKDKHGFVLAGMEDSRYKEYEIQLEPGDAVFVYTDGVAEATNAQNELYGTDRMINALNIDSTLDVKERVINVRKDIDAFVKEAPQFDDITMLTINYYGNK